MNPQRVVVNRPYFQQLPQLNANRSQQPVVAPQNPPVIVYLPNGNHIIADSAPCDSFASIQPAILDATINQLDNVIRLEDVRANLERRKVQEWNQGWMGRWKRKRWYIACIVVTLIVIGITGGLVGYSLTREKIGSDEVLANDANNKDEKNTLNDVIPQTIDNSTINNNQNNTTANNNPTANDTIPNNTINTTPNNTNNTDNSTNNNSQSQSDNTNNSPTNNNNTSQNNSNNNTTSQSNNGYNPSINYYYPTREYICSLPYQYCSNIPQPVMSYVFGSYDSYNKINSLLQLSRSFNLLTRVNDYAQSSLLDRYNYTEVYKNITRSVQCMSLVIPDNFTQAYHEIVSLQVVTQLHKELYLNLAVSSSGQPIKLSAHSAYLSQSCLFDIAYNANTSHSTRLLQNSTDTTSAYQTSTNNCNQNQSQVLIYVHPFMLSPVAVVTDIKKIQYALSTSSTTSSLINGVISMGMWRKPTNTTNFYNTVIPAFQQLLAQSGTTTIPSKNSTLSALKLLANQCPTSNYLPLDYTPDTYKKLAQFFTRKVIQSLVTNSSQYQPVRHKQFISQQLNEGKKVIIIAHSQAAIYANRVYNQLDSIQRNSVGLVYIAPVSRNMTDGSSNYITNPNDQVIQYLRTYAQANTSFPLALSPNMTPMNFTFQSTYSLNHYLQGYLTSYKDKFITLISSARSRTILPTPSWGNGPITVTLLWDNQPDVDLHIYEPGGIHVYYQNRRGYNGYLDADDTFMYGPEHYYANCSLQEGNYTVRLNYYAGVNASSVLVTVTAGNQYLIKTMELNRPMGNAGNDNPPHYVCTVVVKYNNVTNSNDLRILQ